MKVLADGQSLPEEWVASAVSIGAYDGVHLGHRALIGEMTSRASSEGLASVVVTFDRHPASVVRPDSAPHLLTDTEQKLELLASTGIDAVRMVTFDRARSEQAPEEFVRSVLVDELRARLVVVGSDFHFGKGRRGNLSMLAQMGRKSGFGVEGVQLIPGGTAMAPGGGYPPVAPGGDVMAVPISSTRIRTLLSEGKVEAAAALLGRNHEVRGRVEHGDGRGASELGCPTANIELPTDIVLPADGIYAGWCSDLGGTAQPSEPPKFVRAAMVASVGKRPTFYRSAASSLLEVHVLDLDADLYDRRLAVCFARRLREERRFDSAAELVQQIGRDIEATRRVLGVSGS